MGITLSQDLGLCWEPSDLPIPIPQALGIRNLMSALNKQKPKTLNPTIIIHDNPNLQDSIHYQGLYGGPF